ncbi:DUF3124 domain-containing protein [Geomonas nitrogeniifigens]|uniref:DUF3124 domain-containing protein n=1 Tax=Geomonas diazotrophica TaxID=2843197 RepID=A0ABX8JQW0_9BACT|nr:DUF3124 domain-containing protein [Geomonas nitrogeniifigens]QWV99446.1 DUF3124 domain-containing protein [Geomonas nitrogeniifigens]QXE88622.1 DUF3124 domain-containing protein [Geomonas nitrogeniifigens]
MRLVTCLLLSLLALPAAGWSASDVRLSKGQTVYVPAYSNVFSGPRSLPFQLATTLSIRNTDMDSWLRITSIDYYDTSGKLLRHYQDKPLSLAPLASTYVHIEEKDVAGGFGANFIVKWQADHTINTPIIECVMIGATSGQGISFVSPGQAIRPGIR